MTSPLVASLGLTPFTLPPPIPLTSFLSLSDPLYPLLPAHLPTTGAETPCQHHVSLTEQSKDLYLLVGMRAILCHRLSCRSLGLRERGTCGRISITRSFCFSLSPLSHTFPEQTFLDVILIVSLDILSFKMSVSQAASFWQMFTCL